MTISERTRFECIIMHTDWKRIVIYWPQAPSDLDR